MIFDILNNTFAGQVPEGKHIATITKWEFIINEKRPDNSYVRLDMLLDGTREYHRNLFEKDLTFFLSHTRRQLHMECEDIQPKQYMNDLIKNKTPLDIWVTYPVVSGRNGFQKQVQNISWLEPQATAAETVVDENDIPMGDDPLA